MDKLYYWLTDLEKKEFLRDFIESVEIYPEKMDNGRMLKQINFNFPVRRLSCFPRENPVEEDKG